MVDLERELEELQSRANAVVSHVKALEYPLVFEFSGSPKAGKSTVIDTVLHFYKRSGFKVWGPTEGASKRTPYHLRKDLVAFNAWTLTYSIQELLVSYYNVEKQDIVILDRGPFDSLAWMRWLSKNGKLSDEEYQTIKLFALHPRWMGLINKVYLFTCDSAVSLKREHNAKLTKKGGTAMNEETLDALKLEYEQLKQVPVSTMAIDTSQSVSPLGTAYEVALDIMNQLELAIRR